MTTLAVTSVNSLLCQATTCFHIDSKFRCIRSTPAEMQSTSENDFECFASTGVNTPATAKTAIPPDPARSRPMDGPLDRMTGKPAVTAVNGGTKDKGWLPKNLLIECEVTLAADSSREQLCLLSHLQTDLRIMRALVRAAEFSQESSSSIGGSAYQISFARLKAGWKYGLEAAVMSTVKSRILLKKKW